MLITKKIVADKIAAYLHHDITLAQLVIVMQKLKDIMSPDVQVISPDATIREAAEPMREGDCGMMPVGEDDRMIGAISDRDIAIRAVAEGSLWIRTAPVL